jgi:hypothetical protein
MSKRITFNPDDKYDLQLSRALIDERRLAEIFEHGDISRIELKGEEWLWERTGNLCLEYEWNGEPSGIAVTKSGYWVHELKRDGVTLVYLMFPIERLKELGRMAFRAGRYRVKVGDNGKSAVVLVPLQWVLR